MLSLFPSLSSRSRSSSLALSLGVFAAVSRSPKVRTLQHTLSRNAVLGVHVIAPEAEGRHTRKVRWRNALESSARSEGSERAALLVVPHDTTTQLHQLCRQAGQLA